MNDIPPMFQLLQKAMSEKTLEEKVRIRRMVTGEDQNDLIRRGDVYDIIRSLRTNPVPSVEYQKGISDVQRRVANLDHKEGNG